MSIYALPDLDSHSATLPEIISWVELALSTIALWFAGLLPERPQRVSFLTLLWSIGLSRLLPGLFVLNHQHYSDHAPREQLDPTIAILGYIVMGVVLLVGLLLVRRRPVFALGTWYVHLRHKGRRQPEP